MLNKLFVIDLKFKFDCVSHIFYDNPACSTQLGTEGRPC